MMSGMTDNSSRISPAKKRASDVRSHISTTASSSLISLMADSDTRDGKCSLGISIMSPGMVVCSPSPDSPINSCGDTPEFLKKLFSKNLEETSLELSLEEGIAGSELNDTYENNTSAKFWQNTNEEVYPEASFELPLPPENDKNLPKRPLSIISINAGTLEDKCFMGGDIIKTQAVIGDREALSLYQTARFGNFSYHFGNLECGHYIVDLHLAEIVFTEGPPGMRVFDVFMQEQKVASSIDIYARVGANRPLVVSDLEAYVNVNEGLTIRFEGKTGRPLVCGLSIRRDYPLSIAEVQHKRCVDVSQKPELDKEKEIIDLKTEGEFQKLQREYELQKTELTETKKFLNELKKENELKTKECREAWTSLKDLQNELMRKSMHVGSLAFAIEGQVKEKSRWFSSLKDLTRKLKILKMEHLKMSEAGMAHKKYLKEMIEMSSTIQSTLNRQSSLHEELKLKFIEGAKERKDLYNRVLELKGNIRVFCRCRPLNAEEIAAQASMAIDFDSAKEHELMVKANGAPKRVFKFDAVFGPQADQAEVFKDTAPLATSVLDGYNVCIFAYGQTGTGKTFTMEGTEESRGVNFRTLEELFRIINEREKLFLYEISVSVLEVYNEQIRDLLVSGSQPGITAKRLEIRQIGEGIHHVPGLVQAQVKNMNEVWEVLQTGSNSRAVGSTHANEHSSRSHCIHCVMVKGDNLLNGETTRSKLWLVDLAGSERVAKTEVQGERLKETQNINRSLSALGDVISALATKSPHVPFRNSKLTHLLQDSLGGDSKTLMFVQISPNENDLSETLCSLNFASRVRGIELGPAKKQVENNELLKCKQMVEKTKQEAKSKDVQIKKLEDTIHVLDMKVKERDLKNKNLQDKLKELESQLLIERKLARQHVDTKIIEQQQEQQIEQNTSARPPLAARPFGLCRNFNESSPHNTLSKEEVSLARPLTENNSSNRHPLLLPPTECFSNQRNAAEKENNPGFANLPLPKRTGRASIGMETHQIPAAISDRRNSLIPLPTSLVKAKLPPQPPCSPFPTIQADSEEDGERIESEHLPQQTFCLSPKELKSGSKKLSSILRKSLHKKLHGKSPMQQHIRKGGVNVGMEKVRVSIGSRGRILGHNRVVYGNGRRVGMKETPQKQNQKEKERGWNTGTAGRTVI